MLGAIAAIPAAVAAETVRVPVLVPITGFLALEGTSQMNGALLAIREAGVGTSPDPLAIEAEVADTGVSPEVALTQLERALAQGRPPAIIAPMLGTQMLALIPRATEAKVPLVTVSGTAKITELGSGYVFRFFPGDAVVKAAQARYTVEELKARRRRCSTRPPPTARAGASIWPIPSPNSAPRWSPRRPSSPPPRTCCRR